MERTGHTSHLPINLLKHLLPIQYHQAMRLPAAFGLNVGVRGKMGEEMLETVDFLEGEEVGFEGEELGDEHLMPV